MIISREINYLFAQSEVESSSSSVRGIDSNADKNTRHYYLLHGTEICWLIQRLITKDYS
jgi:hypothetical protein